jgi:lysophospholipase
VVLSGGRTEPIEKYFETIRDFMDRGFTVLAHDWRGQGLSQRELPDRLKGHARGFKAYLEDYRRLLDAYQDRLPKPWIAVGHSMGGCLTLLALAHGEKRFVGAALSAPMLGLKAGKYAPMTVAAFTALSVAFGRAGRYMLGQAGTPFDDTFEDNILTHDAGASPATAPMCAPTRTWRSGRRPGAGSTSRSRPAPTWPGRNACAA